MEIKNPLPHINNEPMKSDINRYIYRHHLRIEALKFRPAGICYTEVPSHLLLCNKTLIRIGDGVCNSIKGSW